MNYRRAKINGATYFFTVVTHDRKPFLCRPENVELLRKALRNTMVRHPIEVDAFVLLPDHLHTIWTLPDDDHDFSTRWRQIKSYFSRHCTTTFERATSTSRKTKNERAFWQRRFWEHTIKDIQDYTKHIEYIHYNPVKHGLANAPKDWKYSSFHRYVKAGVYDANWAAGQGVSLNLDIGNE